MNAEEYLEKLRNEKIRKQRADNIKLAIVLLVAVVVGSIVMWLGGCASTGGGDDGDDSSDEPTTAEVCDAMVEFYINCQGASPSDAAQFMAECETMMEDEESEQHPVCWLMTLEYLDCFYVSLSSSCSQDGADAECEHEYERADGCTLEP